MWVGTSTFPGAGRARTPGEHRFITVGRPFTARLARCEAAPYVGYGTGITPSSRRPARAGRRTSRRDPVPRRGTKPRLWPCARRTPKSGVRASRRDTMGSPASDHYAPAARTDAYTFCRCIRTVAWLPRQIIAGRRFEGAKVRRVRGSRVRRCDGRAARSLYLVVGGQAEKRIHSL